MRTYSPRNALGVEGKWQREVRRLTAGGYVRNNTGVGSLC